jgi:hypothetical protein
MASIWEYINAANNEIAFNRVVNNTPDSIFYALRNIQFVTNSLLSGARLSGARFCGLTC